MSLGPSESDLEDSLNGIQRLTAAIGSGLIRWAVPHRRRFAQRVRRWYAWRAKRYPRLFVPLRPRMTIEIDRGTLIECDGADRIQSTLIFEGVWEADVSAALRALLRTGDVFVDVGANVGVLTLIGARLVGEAGQVVAVEPWRPNLERLLANLSRNDIQNVTVLSIALSDHCGNVCLAPALQNNSGSVAKTSSLLGGLSALAAPLHTVLSPELIGRVRLLKIDVEGMEPAVLRGASRLFESDTPPCVICETNSRAGTESNHVEATVEFFRDRGYQALWSPDEGSRERGWRLVTLDSFPTTRTGNGLFVPESFDLKNLLQALSREGAGLPIAPMAISQHDLARC